MFFKSMNNQQLALIMNFSILNVIQKINSTLKEVHLVTNAFPKE